MQARRLGCILQDIKKILLGLSQQVSQHHQVWRLQCKGNDLCQIWSFRLMNAEKSICSWTHKAAAAWELTKGASSCWAIDFSDAYAQLQVDLQCGLPGGRRFVIGTQLHSVPVCS